MKVERLHIVSFFRLLLILLLLISCVFIISVPFTFPMLSVPFFVRVASCTEPLHFFCVFGFSLLYLFTLIVAISDVVFIYPKPGWAIDVSVERHVSCICVCYRWITVRFSQFYCVKRLSFNVWILFAFKNTHTHTHSPKNSFEHAYSSFTWMSFLLPLSSWRYV